MSLDQSAINLMEQVELNQFAKRQGNLGQLMQVMGLLDAEKSIKSTARVREAEDAMAIKMLTGKPPEPEEDLATSIVFGDVNHAPPALQPPAKPGLGTLAKLGIGAALMAIGVGAGAAIPIIWDALRPKPDVTTPGTNTTTERDYQIGEITVE